MAQNVVHSLDIYGIGVGRDGAILASLHTRGTEGWHKEAQHIGHPRTRQ